MTSDGLGVAAIFAACVSAIGWLANRLFSAQEKQIEAAASGAAEARKERDALRVVIDTMYAKAQSDAIERDREFQRTRDELASVKLLLDRRDTESMEPDDRIGKSGGPRAPRRRSTDR